MNIAPWSTLVGLLLILMALSGTLLQRLPLSTSMLYLGVGMAVSPLWLDMARLEPAAHATALERLAEMVLLISLFSSGMKLGARPRDRQWLAPVRLATVSMLITAGLIALVGVWLLKLPLGAAVLLGGILAPTDPVLASDVQVEDVSDRDRLRYALTGEGGLNDGTAFAVVMLGLGLMGQHDIGSFGWRWLLVDVLWATLGGLLGGALLGVAVGKLVLYLRRTHQQAVGWDNFLALGLIGLSYGLALLGSASGFLAVFAAGCALRQIERRATAQAGASARAAEAEQAHEPAGAAAADPAALAASALAVNTATVATHPQHAPAYLALAMLGFNEQLERIGEAAAVIAVGMLLWAVPWHGAALWFVPLLLLVLRPLAVAAGLLGTPTSAAQRGLVAWFGIRGIGSLYYLVYALTHGVGGPLGDMLAALTLSAVVCSIVVHGISVTPLMALYQGTQRRRAPAARGGHADNGPGGPAR